MLFLILLSCISCLKNFDSKCKVQEDPNAKKVVVIDLPVKNDNVNNGNGQNKQQVAIEIAKGSVNHHNNGQNNGDVNKK